MYILVVTGASGSGKTSAVRTLEARGVPGVGCFYFDSIGVPSPEAMQRDHDGGEQWQAWATRRWLLQLDQLDSTIRVAVLDAQTRPSFVESASAECRRRQVRTILLDCERSERERWLHTERGQPELATTEMALWAAYLRGQADALALRVVDTSRIDPIAVTNRLVEIIERLQSGEVK